jgi:hypothetical protein
MPIVPITLTKTSSGLNLYRAASRSTSTTAQVKFVALGTGNSTPTAAQTILDSEASRKAATSYTDGTTGQEVVDFYISPDDAVNVDIAEVAVFAGTTATATVNSGVMLGRGLYSKPDKTNLESIVLRLYLNFA